MAPARGTPARARPSLGHGRRHAQARFAAMKVAGDPQTRRLREPQVRARQIEDVSRGARSLEELELARRVE